MQIIILNQFDKDLQGDFKRSRDVIKHLNQEGEINAIADIGSKI